MVAFARMEMERWWEVRIEEVDHLRKKDVLGSCHNIFPLACAYMYDVVMALYARVLFV